MAQRQPAISERSAHHEQAIIESQADTQNAQNQTGPVIDVTKPTRCRS